MYLFCIMAISACEIWICCSDCIHSSSICSSCCFSIASCSFFRISISSWRIGCSLLAFSFRNLTISPPLLRLFLAPFEVESRRSHFSSFVPLPSFLLPLLPLYLMTFSSRQYAGFLPCCIALQATHLFLTFHTLITLSFSSCMRIFEL